MRRAAPQEQAGRQFSMDFVLFLLAGLLLAGFNLLFFGFPLVSSGSKLVLSLATVGYFASIDLSLMRERELIQRAKKLGVRLHPPERLSPLARKFSLVASSILVLVALSVMLLFWRDIIWLTKQVNMGGMAAKLKGEVMLEISFVMGALLMMTIRVILSYSGNLQLLFKNETQVLEQVSKGDLGGAVPVLTNDEFGFIAGHTNTMIEGLRDRMRMREGLIVAREVQQNLLPASAPQLPHTAIFGRSHFSDETGGDFYDFYEDAGPGGNYVGVVLGDVSGHGVGPALLMASARAMFRLRMVQGSDLATCLTDVNRQLAGDLFGSGRFMTVYAMLVHKQSGEITVCVAGHDPAIVYDPETDTFSEFGGHGLPLGVEAEWEYQSASRAPLRNGELFVLGTDGIWETQSPEGEMFGKDRLRQLIRQCASNRQQPGDHIAPELEQCITNALQRFSHSDKRQDDISLVVLQGLQQTGAQLEQMPQGSGD